MLLQNWYEKQKCVYIISPIAIASVYILLIYCLAYSAYSAYHAVLCVSNATALFGKKRLLTNVFH